MAVVGSFLLGIRVVLAAVFAVAGTAKLLDGAGTRRSLSEFGVPSGALPVAALLLPLLELATAVALIPPGSARWGALAALALLLGFIGGIANALARGEAPDCHCFGQVHSAPAGRGTLIRNAVLAALAAVVVLEGPGPSVPDWVSARTPAELVAVAAGAAAIALAALALGLWSDRRRLQRDLAAAQAEVAALPPGLPVGAPAPRFALAELGGETRTLESLCARGRPVMLVFVSPGCGPCQSVFREIGRWQGALSDRLTVAVISSGTAAENLPIAREHGITGMLLQEDFEVFRAYRVRHTPSALVVAPGGAIASAPAEGPPPIEPLVRLTLRRWPAAPAPGPAIAQ
jgi:uncharacterized membrane protein YphA (DoxX/SURF4 family)/thiol-disulfide isomerase/thioredoxin